MSIRKSLWLLVGVILWGVPLGITIPFLSAFLTPENWGEIHSFQPEVFIKNLFIFFPIFVALGLCYGLWMHYLSQKSK